MDTFEPKLSARPRNIDPEEWAVRVDLAACYRLTAHFGMDDLILGHISARVPGAEGQFLINTLGLVFKEVPGSSPWVCCATRSPPRAFLRSISTEIRSPRRTTSPTAPVLSFTAPSTWC